MRATHLQPVTPVEDDSAELITEFIVQADVCEATRTKYRTHLSDFVAFLNAPTIREPRDSVHVADAQSRDIQRFMAYLQTPTRANAHWTARGEQLSASTRKNYLASLRSFYRYLVAVQVIDADPTLAIKTPRVRIARGLVLSAVELRRLLDTRGSLNERIAVNLLVYTGARSGEIRDLRWSDVDFAQRSITLTGKGGKSRTIAIHPRLMSELRGWYIRQTEAAERDPRVAAARRNPDTDYVLLSRTGARLSSTAIYKHVNRRAAHAELHVLEPAHRELRSRVTPHTLRRSFATLLLNSGEPLDAVADVLGHDSTDTTRTHYAFSNHARRRATVEAFDI